MHQIYMQKALELAEKARGQTSPNPLVGAVLVRDGQIVGQGYHHKAGTPHAEIHALREAGEKARGACLYVTLEPCCHQGRTGPCTQALIQAGVGEVYAAMADPNPLVAGKGLAQLEQAGIKTHCGLLEEQSRRMNEIFLTFITQNRPWILLKAAMSLDGKIATATGDSKWITGETARHYGRRLRGEVDAILVGIGTVLADDPALTTRLPGAKNPRRIVLDNLARTPLTAQILRPEAPTLIVVSRRALPDKVQALQKAGAEVWQMNSEQITIPALLAELKKREISSLLVEGGGQIHASFLPWADKFCWFIAPKIIGGNAAPGPIGGKGIQKMAEAVHLERMKLTKLGEDLLLEAWRKR